MTTQRTGRSRRGLPAWLRAGSIGLVLGLAGELAAHPPWGPGRGVATGEDLGAEDGDATAPVPPAPSSTGRTTARLVSTRSTEAGDGTGSGDGLAASIARARKIIADCLARYESVRDYSCVFHKRERIDGKLLETQIMALKARNRPDSLYFKFVQPNRGREAIFDPARHGGKLLAHDVGIARLLAGTMHLDPVGPMAMEENRHPVTEAGIGMLIRTVMRRWETELDPSVSLIEIHPNARVGHRPCTMVESTHPSRRDDFFFYRVKLFVDQELGLPIRYEAYDWPAGPGTAPELVEEYTYTDLKTDVGLTDSDFDPANPRYAFGRF